MVVNGQVVKNGQYVFFNVLGVAYKVEDRVIGTYGAIVKQMVDGKLVRVFL
jgi:hypothetical protein